MARIFAVVFLAMSLGCATTSQPERYRFATVVGSSPEEWKPWPAHANPGTIGQLAASIAASLVGLKSMYQAGHAAQGLPDDCTGLVRFAWRQLGVDLFDGFTMPNENGVTAMYRAALSHDAFHEQLPQPGDLVFFRETYDRNRDGALNDGLTHVGIVEASHADGTVTFIHHVNRGVVRGVMNLAQPLRYMAAGKIMNDYLRPASKRAPSALTGELFVGFSTPELDVRPAFSSR